MGITLFINKVEGEKVVYNCLYVLFADDAVSCKSGNKKIENNINDSTDCLSIGECLIKSIEEVPSCLVFTLCNKVSIDVIILKRCTVLVNVALITAV